MSDRPPAPGKLLGIDLGLARIGLATCDPLRLGVRPVEVIQRRSRRQDFARIAQLLVQEEAEAVICGLPVNMDGSEGDQARMTREWAMRLAQALRALLGRPVEIIFWDERLSTFAAQQIMADSGMTAAEDAVAAAVMLQSYLDAWKSGDGRDYGAVRLQPVQIAHDASGDA